MTYTPRPWRIASPKILFDKDSEHDRLIYAEGGRHVAEVFQYQNHEHNLSREEVEANALLIAAAPAMFEELILIVAGWEAIASGQIPYRQLTDWEHERLGFAKQSIEQIKEY